MFPNDCHRATDPSRVADMLAAAARSAGVPVIRPHALRATHSTLLLDTEVAVAAVSERLGHSSPAITLATYAKVTPETRQAATDKVAAIFA